VINLHFMKVSTEIVNNFGYEKIMQLVDNIPSRHGYSWKIAELALSNNNHSYNTCPDFKNLMQESSRYQGALRQDRLCLRCTSGEIDDEKHFLISCSTCPVIRTEMFSRINNICQNFLSIYIIFLLSKHASPCTV
jgi:hypothetical protein